MARAKTSRGKPRKRCSAEFKSEAVSLAERVGVKAAAEQRLAFENARLRRQLAEQAQALAIVKQAAAYFANEMK